MPVSLAKGGNVNLNKEATGLQKINVGLGWDTRLTDGAAFDLDSSCFLLGATERVRSDQDFVFYNNKTSSCGGVVHGGDNTSGAGAGDDEVVAIELGRVHADVQKVAFAVTIHDAEARRQNFGMVRNAFIRVVNAGNGVEIARYDLSEDYSMETALVFGEIYRNGADWKFRAVGQGHTGGLSALARSYGVDL